jgi:hypothetical protein
VQWREVADQLGSKVSKLAAQIDEAELDVRAYMGFLTQHWVKLAKMRCRFIPITRRMAAPMVASGGERRATRHLRIRVHGATGRVAEAASY